MYVCRLKNINSTIIEQTKFHGKDTCFSWYNGLGNWSKNINFVLDDKTFDLTTCPVRNTSILKKHGLKKGNKNET